MKVLWSCQCCLRVGESAALMMGIKKTSIIERERNLADIYVHTLHCSSTDETHCVLERDGEFVVVLIFL